MSRTYIYLLLVIVCSGCGDSTNENYQTDANNAAYLHRCVNRLTEVMVHDIFSPPVASRLYCYTSLAAHEVMIQRSETHQSLEGQLKGFKGVPKLEHTAEICLPLAAVQAYLKMAEELTFSKDSIRLFSKNILKEFKNIGIPQTVFDASIHYGNQVYQAVSNYAAQDNYSESRTYPTYTILKEEGKWTPTPPAYMDAIEPYWNTIRTLTLDSAQQFKPIAPATFDLDKKSTFYQEMMEVYTTTQNLTEEQQLIAGFWDCNPFAVKQKGHLMTSVKKITPGGHWIGIAGIAAKAQQQNMEGTAATYAMTSIALFDGFISCWDEKYRSHLVRPETIINATLDPEWKPLLQTPPFPEYTSGHSVISAAAATVLTHLFGENFNFIDDTEVPYNLPTRSYTSFFEASEEAAISRLYGGIHYRPACAVGVEQGKKVGKWVVQHIRVKSQ